MEQNKQQRWLLLAMIASMCIWGISWSSAKVLSGYGTPLSIAFIRFAFVPITLYPLMKWAKIPVRISKKAIWHVLGASAFMTAYTLCFFRGLQLGQPGAAGVLVTIMNPLFAYLIGLIISKMVPQGREIIGLVIGLLAGTVLLNIWEQPDALFIAGNGLFLLAALIWAIMSKITANAKRFGNAISFTYWLHVATLVLMAPFLNWTEVSSILTTGDQKFWGNMLYFGIINSGLATTCFLYTAAKIGPEKASSFIFIVPCAAALAAWIFMGEQIAAYTITGGIMGILAVLIINGTLLKKRRSS